MAFIAPASKRNSTKLPVSKANRTNVRTTAPMTPRPFLGMSRTRRSHMKLMRVRPSTGRSEAEDLRVSFHVHEPVPAHVEGDDLPLPRLFAFHRLVDRAGDAVRALRSRQESLGL